MAGTLLSLSLSQQWDANGVPISGGLLKVYAAETDTPVTTYTDFELTPGNESDWPIELNSAGRIEAFYVETPGLYRVRLETSAEVMVFDEDNVPAIGPAEETSVDAITDTTKVFDTGDPLWVPRAGTRSGWVRANARTIGNAASGATERANADTEDLYLYLYDTFSDTLCPVSGGRGASGAADFAANKTIGTLDMRGCGPFGLDDMGNSAASVIAAGTPTTAGTGGGAETATIAQANLPNVNLSSASLTAATVLTNGDNVVRSTTYIDNVPGGGSENNVPKTAASATITAATTIGGNVPLGGSGTAVNKMPPYRLGTWYLKL